MDYEHLGSNHGDVVDNVKLIYNRTKVDFIDVLGIRIIKELSNMICVFFCRVVERLEVNWELVKCACC